jgi:hypothetical protein
MKAAACPYSDDGDFLRRLAARLRALALLNESALGRDLGKNRFAGKT